MMRMSYDKFEVLENELACLPVPEEGYIPDLEKIKRTARTDHEYLLFLIWYQSVSDERKDDTTKKSVNMVWDEINDMVNLY